MPDTLMIHGAHRNTHQTPMNTIGRGPNREDGWMDMDVSNISDLQVLIHLKFNLDWRKIIECPESNEWGWFGGGKGAILQIGTLI